MKSSGIPQWLQKAIDVAHQEGRIIRDTGCAAFSASEPVQARHVPFVDPGMGEDEFQDKFLETAANWGWKCIHIYPLQTSKGTWKTPVAGDGKGFPDNLCLRGPVQFVAELKAGKNKTTDEQDSWLKAFRDAGVPTFVWYPEDWPEILRMLQYAKL